MDHDAHTDDPAPPTDPVADRTVRTGQGRTILVGAAAVVAVLVAAVGLTSGSGDGGLAAGPVPSVGTPPSTSASAAAAFGLTDAVAELPPATLGAFAGGEEVEVADLLGGAPLVLNFWATWCAPCVAEMPDLQALHEAAGPQLRLVGINTRDALPNAEPFAEELGITYEVYTDREGDYFLDTGSFGMPTTLFVRADGTVAYRHTGPMTLQQAADLVAAHLDVDVAVAA